MEQKKTNWIPWIIGGAIILILIYFALQGGIGAASDETSEYAAQQNNYSSGAPAPTGSPQ